MALTFNKTLAIFTLAAIAACEGTGLDVGDPEPGGKDRFPPMSMPPPTLSSIREDFISLQLIDKTANVIHNVNAGLVQLPTIHFPTLAGEAEKTYDYPAELNGSINAAQIIVMPEGTLRASDAVELIATDLVHISGQIIAGPGGVTIAAGQNVVINGSIESEGPIRVLLSNPYGTINVRGRVIAYSNGEREVPSSINLLGRGNIEITGILHTKASRQLAAGHIALDAYGPIHIRRGQVNTSADEGGSSGAIRIRSETRVAMINAIVGEETRAVDPLTSPLSAAGKIEIQAPEIELGDGTEIVGGNAPGGNGGSIELIAGRNLIVGVSAHVSAGTGFEGGSIVVHTTNGTIGEASSLSGGLGLKTAGSLRIEASSSLSLGLESRLSGGDGICADGGSASVFVAGELTLAVRSVITGGAGGASTNQRPCALQRYNGGTVEVIVHHLSGDDSGVRAGDGLFWSEAEVEINPNHEVSAPNLTVAASGWIESKIVDRGEALVGQIPVLRSLLPGVSPDGTEAKLELAGSATLDEPIDQWFAVDQRVGGLEPLRDARYFRYKLTLVGRAFDTPVVDFFEIDLAPASR